MLIRPADRPLSDDEWRSFLATLDFGQLVAPGRGRDLPVVVPTHFVYAGGDVALFHLARGNPVWRALDESPRALLTVVGAYTYVDAALNTEPGESPEFGIPTSYYATVQVAGTCELVDDPAELAAFLNAQMDHFEPGRDGAPVSVDNEYGKSLGGIRGVRFHFDDVRAKFKFGGNRTRAHQAAINATLLARGTDLDSEAAAIQLRRLRARPAPEPEERHRSRGGE
ncbi:MAG TPA: FMN-binding negative transcriptional regulator [Actinomycetota bacterium]|nr:FMN-binding negative transcriptional regulator [Actinomycetota bacterium]